MSSPSLTLSRSTATMRKWLSCLIISSTVSYSIHSRFDWLALPHNIESAPNEAVARMSLSLMFI